MGRCPVFQSIQTSELRPTLFGYAGIPGKPSGQTGFGALTYTGSLPPGLRGVYTVSPSRVSAGQSSQNRSLDPAQKPGRGPRFKSSIPLHRNIPTTPGRKPMILGSLRCRRLCLSGTFISGVTRQLVASTGSQARIPRIAHPAVGSGGQFQLRPSLLFKRSGESFESGHPENIKVSTKITAPRSRIKMRLAPPPFGESRKSENQLQAELNLP
jgi:hypothetical protein